MFESVFQWTARHGSRLLFVVAAIMILLGAVVTAIRFANTAEQVAAGRAAYDVPYGNLLMLLGGLLSAVKEATVPLVAAIVLDRFDRWIIHRQSSD